MNVIDYLTNDHRQVSNLFAQLGDPSSPDAASLTISLIDSLRLHGRQEETYLYPRLRGKEQTAKFVDEAEAEHGNVKKLLAQLEQVRVGSLDWHDTIEMLQEDVTHHVEEEENEIFPAMREAFTDEELEEMGNSMMSIMAQ